MGADEWHGLSLREDQGQKLQFDVWRRRGRSQPYCELIIRDWNHESGPKLIRLEMTEDQLALLATQALSARLSLIGFQLESPLPIREE